VITGQATLSTKEDTPITLRLQDLTVNDPDNAYPADFSLQILPGKNYTIKDLTITPAPNFNGSLAVSVTVNDGELDSQPYSLTIAVTPVNDAPQIVNFETNAIQYVAGRGPVAVSQTIGVLDVDDDNIALAEVFFEQESYRPGQDVLIFQGSDSIDIDGVFDPARGTMIFIGSAPPGEYQKAFRAIRYDYIDDEESTSPPTDTVKTLSFSVSDGQLKSAIVSRKIRVISTISLDIPNAFTPNGDLSNDTWKVTPIQTFDDYSDALIRVYNIRGQLLYEAKGFESSWDGTHNGETLPSDTYYFTIDLNLSYRAAKFKGVVTLLR
jgi:gliding motility-associated-like protein